MTDATATTSTLEDPVSALRELCALQFQHEQQPDAFRSDPFLALASTLSSSVQDPSDDLATAAAAAASSGTARVDRNADHVTQSIQAWDQIGELTSELGVSMIVRQASLISERFLREEQAQKRRIAETAALTQNFFAAMSSRPAKRTKLGSVDSSCTSHLRRETGSNDTRKPRDAVPQPPPFVAGAGAGAESPAPVVSCDEDSEAAASINDRDNDDDLATQCSFTIPSSGGVAPTSGLFSRSSTISESLSRQIDRMARMSQLMMIMEQTKDTLREEMLSMLEDEQETDNDNRNDNEQRTE